MVTRAVSSWSLHRTLGRYVASGLPSHGDGHDTVEAGEGLPLLDLPAELRRHGYDTLHLVHFHIPSRSEAYLNQLRAALEASGIELDTLLVDDGDLTDPANADEQEAWIGGWLETATALGARRARVMAGRSAPTPELVEQSGKRLARLAAAHPQVRVVTENWMGMMPDSATVLAVLDEAGNGVSLLIDLGNWRGPDKYDELAAVAPRAETCHAKCHYTGTEPEREDFLQSLRILKDAGYDGPLALIYDSEDDHEWANLDLEFEIVRDVFAPS